ncbi:MAG: hypothetical protein WCA46_16750, partial [Actinocatenispora sp.]
ARTRGPSPARVADGAPPTAQLRTGDRPGTGSDEDTHAVDGRAAETRRADRVALVRRYVPHVAVMLGYLALGVWVTGHVWVSPDTRALVNDPVDQEFMEWVLAYGAHVVGHLADPFYTVQVNAPQGANMMANTSLIVPGIVLAPVTMLFGPAVSFVLLETVALAGTAAGWYVVFLRRRFVRSRLAAALGAGLVGFAPGMVALSNSHVHLTAQFFVPFIVSLVLPAPSGRRERPVARGVLLAVLVTAQLLTGTETLLCLGLGTVTFVAVLAVLRPADTRRVLRDSLLRLGVAAAVGVVLMAYPLWMVLAGPMHTDGTPWSIHWSGTDVLSWVWYGRYSMLAGPSLAAPVHAVNTIDQTSYLGIALVALLTAIVVWLRRNRTAVALTVTALVYVVFSFGTHLVVLSQDTHIPGPWKPLAQLPLLNAALPDRFALVATTALGALLALGADRMIRAGSPRAVWAAAFAAALLPIVPAPLPAQHRNPIPPFFTSGQWRQHVRPGHTMLAVPLQRPVDRRGERWSSGTNADLAIPGGAIMIPDHRGQARWGVPLSRLSKTLRGISHTGRIPPIGAAERAEARRELAATRTDCIVLGPHVRHVRQVRTALDRYVRTGGRYVAGVWVWDT